LYEILLTKNTDPAQQFNKLHITQTPDTTLTLEYYWYELIECNHVTQFPSEVWVLQRIEIELPERDR